MTFVGGGNRTQELGEVLAGQGCGCRDSSPGSATRSIVPSSTAKQAGTRAVRDNLGDPKQSEQSEQHSTLVILFDTLRGRLRSGQPKIRGRVRVVRHRESQPQLTALCEG